MQLGYQLCCLVYEIVQDIPSPYLDLNTTTDDSFEDLINTPSLTTIQKELRSTFFNNKVDKALSKRGLQNFTSPRKKRALGFTYSPPQLSNQRRGRNPICRGCNIAIEKTEPRIIHSYIENQKFVYANQHIYHVELACLKVLKPEYLSSFCDKKWAQTDVRKIVNCIQKQT